MTLDVILYNNIVLTTEDPGVVINFNAADIELVDLDGNSILIPTRNILYIKRKSNELQRVVTMPIIGYQEDENKMIMDRFNKMDFSPMVEQSSMIIGDESSSFPCLLTKVPESIASAEDLPVVASPSIRSKADAELENINHKIVEKMLGFRRKGLSNEQIAKVANLSVDYVNEKIGVE